MARETGSILMEDSPNPPVILTLEPERSALATFAKRLRTVLRPERSSGL